MGYYSELSIDTRTCGEADEDARLDRIDGMIRTHLRYGHLRRDLFAPVYFCACGALATIIVYGDPDAMLCDRCHAGKVGK